MPGEYGSNVCSVSLSMRGEGGSFLKDMPLSKMAADAVPVLRDRELVFPKAPNSRLKAIRKASSSVFENG